MRAHTTTMLGDKRDVGALTRLSYTHWVTHRFTRIVLLAIVCGALGAILSCHSSAEICTDARDNDGDGFVDRRETLVLLSRLGVQIPSESALKSLIDRADMDENGQLDFEEFCEFVKAELSPHFIEQALRLLPYVHVRFGSFRIFALKAL